MPWYVLYTAARHEKKVEKRLQRMGIEVYCPMVVQLKQWSDRKKKVEVPVLPSYVFVCLEPNQRELVFQVAGVVRYLYWLGKPAEIRPKELEVLKESLKGVIASFEVTTLAPGSKYTIDTGALHGRAGIVTKIEKNTLFLVLEELGIKLQLRKEGL